MSEELRMNAYYYCFNKTGDVDIDKILSAVASAGKGCHHTDGWNDKVDWLSGKSYIDLIQEAANNAAYVRAAK